MTCSVSSWKNILSLRRDMYNLTMLRYIASKLTTAVSWSPACRLKYKHFSLFTTHIIILSVTLLLLHFLQSVVDHSVNYTTKETKLLYCWMFLLRMSIQGPSTLSKRCLSSLTHLRVPFARTVAARGRLRTRAISPTINKRCVHYNLMRVFWNNVR